MKEYVIEYDIEDNGDTVGMTYLYPPSPSVEEMFYNGVLFKNVNISEDGNYQMTITMPNGDDSTFIIVEILKYAGWAYFYDYTNDYTTEEGL